MKPSIPRGTRDFGPADTLKRNYIFNTIRKNFELFGFQQIETPAMENISTLTGKYGEEGDQLIFKILNSRIHESKNKETLKKEFELSLESSRNSEELTERALRYDLTVPFARYVVMNQHLLTFPFKRYQIQPVWRADKPQKGRYREFYQCDADVIGSDSLLNELELISMIDKVFSELNFPVVLKINNRKVLAAMAEVIGQPDKLIDITVAIDKLDKISLEMSMKELSDRGMPEEAIEKLKEMLTGLRSSDLPLPRFRQLKELFKNNPMGLKGVEELEYIFENSKVGFGTKIELDFTLARGLNYYTGTIFEVKARDGTLTSSILGGGRYDDLTGIFGLKNMSGVGISFGIDRIYDVMEELNKFPEEISDGSSCKVLFLNLEAELQFNILNTLRILRANNISCELYPELTKKINKQFDYLEKNKISFVCKLAHDGVYEVKKTGSNEWEKISGIDNLIQHINK